MVELPAGPSGAGGSHPASPAPAPRVLVRKRPDPLGPRRPGPGAGMMGQPGLGGEGLAGFPDGGGGGFRWEGARGRDGGPGQVGVKLKRHNGPAGAGWGTAAWQRALARLFARTA